MIGPKLSARSYALLVLAVVGLAFTTNLVAQYNQTSGVSSAGDQAAATREVASALNQIAASNREIAGALREIGGTMKEANAKEATSHSMRNDSALPETVPVNPPTPPAAESTNGKVMLQGSPSADNSGAPAAAPASDTDKGTFRMKK